MSSGAAQTWFVVGTIPLIVAGAGHALLAAVDAIRPTFFAPIKHSTRQAMDREGMRFRAFFPGDVVSPSIWRLWLGFNISHGLGVFAFGLLCLLIATHDFDLVQQVPGLQAFSIAVPAGYLVLSLRFWFYLPVLATGSATACFIVAALLAG